MVSEILLKVYIIKYFTYFKYILYRNYCVYLLLVKMIILLTVSLSQFLNCNIIITCSRVTGSSRIFLFIRFIWIVFFSFASLRLSSSELHFGLGLYSGFSINVVTFSAYSLTQLYKINTIRYFSYYSIPDKITFQQLLSIN